MADLGALEQNNCFLLCCRIQVSLDNLSIAKLLDITTKSSTSTHFQTNLSFLTKPFINYFRAAFISIIFQLNCSFKTPNNKIRSTFSLVFLQLHKYAITTILSICLL